MMTMCFAELQDLLSKGKKHLILNEFEQAVDIFEEACKLVSGKYGELADECAESYFLYGKALLEHGRSENNVLNEEPLEEDDADGESDDGEDPGEEQVLENGVDETDKIISNGDANNKMILETNEEADKEADETINEGSMAITNFQVAWEVLDLSRIILSKKDDKESKLKLAETYLTLGQLSLEIENYDKAVSDLLECLDLQRLELDPNDRRIAETCYTLSLAYSLLNNLDSANKSLVEAIGIIVKKIEYLKNDINGKDTTMEITSQSRDNTSEILELESLLKELNEKLEEIKESQEKPFLSTSIHNGSSLDDEQKPSAKTIVSSQILDGHTFVNGTDVLGLPPNPTREADDITHLIKRKKME